MLLSLLPKLHVSVLSVTALLTTYFPDIFHAKLDDRSTATATQRRAHSRYYEAVVYRSHNPAQKRVDRFKLGVDYAYTSIHHFANTNLLLMY